MLACLEKRLVARILGEEMSTVHLNHAVILHGENEAGAIRAIAAFLGDGFQEREAMVVLTSPARLAAIRAALQVRGIELAALERDGRFAHFDSALVHDAVALNGSIDRSAFSDVVLRRVKGIGDGYRLRVYGDVAGQFWGERRFAAAHALEEMWSNFEFREPMAMLCGYPVDVLGHNHTEDELSAVTRLHKTILTPSGEASHTRDQERLRLLVRAGEMFHQSLDVNETLNNVARLAVESFSEVCIFDLLDDQSDRLFVTGAAHRDPTKEELLQNVGQLFYVEEFRTHPVVQVTRTGQPFFLPHIDEAALVGHAASRQHENYMRALEYRSKIVVPVIAQNHIFGALTFVRTRESEEFDESDLLFAIELGRRAGLAVANAKQFHREQYVAETLQRAFLPRTFPAFDGLSISAHYRPGSTEADIGGDWYDAFENDRHELVVTIGDVTGKGIEAARLMVLMRQAIRIAALDATEPYEIADLCNRMLLAEEGERLASAFIGIFNPHTRRLRYVSGGHAPPLLRLDDDAVLALQSPSPPLGAFRDAHFEQHELTCPSESMLVLYTDGIVEAGRDAIAGENMLREVMLSDAIVHAANPAEFVERAIADLVPRDDIAVMVLNFGETQMRRWQFEAADARSAATLRKEFFESLLRMCGASGDELSTCGVIFAELMGNAVRHAPGPLSVTLEVLDDTLVLHLIDKGPGFVYDPHLPTNVWAESGRGLFLISALATNVSVERLPGRGSHIAVTLPVRVDSRHVA